MEMTIASVAALVASPSRVVMIAKLLDGRALPAGELARAAGLSAQCASAHLARLAEGGVLRVEQEGRHRYYTIASPFIAEILENFANLIDQTTQRNRRTVAHDSTICYARTCYDHLAGELGVAIANAMVENGILIPSEGKSYLVDKKGTKWFQENLEIDVDVIKPGRHGIARRCLDWTERRHHLAGPLGTKFFARGCELGWLIRSPSSRAVQLTLTGRKLLQNQLGLSLRDLT